MSNNRKLNEHDLVKTNKELPDIPEGSEGVIVSVHDVPKKPLAYEVEFPELDNVVATVLRKDLNSNMNTKIAYMYRDGSNYKQCDEVVFEGEITEVELRTILDNRDEGQFFIPSQVGMEDLQPRMLSYPSDADHVWHELNREDITLTSDAPTGSNPVSIKDFVRLWDGIEWDVKKATEEHGFDF